MALQAIAAFFVPLSADERNLMYAAARRARLAEASTSTTTNGISPSTLSGLGMDDDTQSDAGTRSDAKAFVPLHPAPPLAFISAHPLCRVAAEYAQEGVQVGHTHYERPEPPPVASTLYVWDISPPPLPELVVHVSRLPLRTSGLAEGLWWLQYVTHSRRRSRGRHGSSGSAGGFTAMRPITEIRLTLEREQQTTPRAHRRRAGEEGGGGRTDVAAVSGSKANPVREEDLTLMDAESGGVWAADDLPVTSLELQQLCFLPAALRLLPCLFGQRLSSLLFTRCSCIYEDMLRDEQRCGYTESGSGREMGVVVVAPPAEAPATASLSSSVHSTSTFLPYGALGLTYLGVAACGTEAFWICLSKFFIFPKCCGAPDATPPSLMPLAVLSLSDNKSLTTKQLQGVLRGVKQRNTSRLPSSPLPASAFTFIQDEEAHDGGAAQCVSLRELDTCFTDAIGGIQWRRDFAGLGTNINRLAMARCPIDGDMVIDVLCAGEARGDVPAAVVSVTEEPFSDKVRRLLLLDMRWNLKVKNETIRKLRDEHAIHCKHLRLAGSGLDWMEGQRFASTVTP